ncbi:hypothetical protein HanRHA438_Chr01g0032991 [Helianthus annuus]|uniref:Uncharacterized protein n=1 Tax=Helianthus annuus TaxID=4232 RepID=A0A251VPZ5_HELAN|nr:hypothetical protein HanXRQr2_Chr01g0032321 [Helianthus annuus]KAJ0627668.1 hypothetical protein HanHA89_Chr01g0028361 [Helianthus annuus]KAJ0783967.1 hypothetical protein HanLR1_Chr01g0026941 [Helianthus annuus]KAJ0948913.1 hypothetical protein HanRHA438_Chr01g0032991 [Helianthus annuus]KAJ0957769.1 hypothetical protein HanPSC8_Chr01g0031511 [Helianthus annuus]
MALVDFLSLENILIKGAVFMIVQALVYFILSNSSDLFSKTKKMSRSFSFKPARSVSIRRIFAAIADMPPGVRRLLLRPVGDFPSHRR